MAISHLVSYLLGMRIINSTYLLQDFLRGRFHAGGKPQLRTIAVSAMPGGAVPGRRLRSRCNNITLHLKTKPIVITARSQDGASAEAPNFSVCLVGAAIGLWSLSGQEATVTRLVVQGPRRRLRFGYRSLAMRENEPDEGALRALGFSHYERARAVTQIPPGVVTSNSSTLGLELGNL
jgi:hypothetical protein